MGIGKKFIDSMDLNPNKEETKKESKEGRKKKKKIGIILMILGVAMYFINIITYRRWGIDIDMLGALIFIIGLIITIDKWKK